MSSIPNLPELNSDAFEPVEAAMQAGLREIFPAAVLLVIWRGQTVLHKAYGFLDPDTRRSPALVDSLFDLASLTKLFTATAFMRLVDSGAVRLDTPVGKILPEFRGERRIGASEDPLRKIELPADPRYAGQAVDLSEVTFRHLLTHTSGLAAWRSIYLAGPPSSGQTPYPHQIPSRVRRSRMAAVFSYDFASPPGAKQAYSDLGFILIGEAIERITGMDLEHTFEQAIFRPLGLQRTCFNPLAHGFSPGEIAPSEVCAWRERRLLGEVDDENAAGLGGAAGHAGLFSTAEESARLGMVYRNHGSHAGGQILAPLTVAEMTRLQAGLEGQRRGLAWNLWTPTDCSNSRCSCGSRFGPRSYGHTGFTGTSLWIDPDRDLLVVALTNRVYHGRGSDAIQGFRPRLHDLVVEAIDRLAPGG
jgi:CubicO group peptidase (beta-lactamase class C family)